MIIIDSKEHKQPLFFETDDKNLMNTIAYLLNKSGVEPVIPDSVILAYRNEKENHYHFSGLNHTEMSDLAFDVTGAIIEVMKHD